jgi:hypothetical protein
LAFDFFDSHTRSDIHIRTESLPPFFRPKLRITTKQIDELIDFRWPRNNIEGVQVSPNRLRRFVKFVVENYGREPAMNCQARLNVVKQIDECNCLSPGDKKALLWENDETRITIGAKHDRPCFYLVFSQEVAEDTSPTYCGITSKDTKDVQTWIATKEAFQNPKRREQDKMCQGRFRVHVDVFTEYGQKVNSDFIIKVGPTWQDLNVERCECQCSKPSRFRRLSHKLFQTTP